MGHQINFFLGPNDLLELEARLKKVDAPVVLHSRSPTRKPRVLDTMNFTEDGKQWLFLYLVRSQDLNSLRIKEIKAQGYWSVDTLTSPVIELDRCYYDGKILRRGRLYYVDGFYEQEEWVEKSSDFKTWAKRLFNVARKTLVYDKELGSHVGAEASAMRLRGRIEFKSF